MRGIIVRREFAGAIITETATGRAAVNGRFFNVVADKDSGRIVSQKFRSERRLIAGYGRGAYIVAEIRFDDSCGNGKESFAITGEIRLPRRRDIEAGGCIHGEIAEVFPELAPLIRFHIFDTAAPMHYIANTVYHAGDRDYNGRRAGEVSATKPAVVFGDNPIAHKLSAKFAAFLKDATPHNGRGAYDFEVIRMDHRDRGKPGKYQFGPKFTFGGFGTAWHDSPFDSEEEAFAFLQALQTCSPRFVDIPVSWSEGKTRDLDAARACAAWPEATDAELMAEPAELRAMLEARLPGLMAEFRAAIELSGLWYAVPEKAWKESN